MLEKKRYKNIQNYNFSPSGITYKNLMKPEWLSPF